MCDSVQSHQHLQQETFGPKVDFPLFVLAVTPFSCRDRIRLLSVCPAVNWGFLSVHEGKHTSEENKSCEMKRQKSSESVFFTVPCEKVFHRNVVVNGDIVLLLGNGSPADCPAVQLEKIRVKVSSCGVTCLDCY